MADGSIRIDTKIDNKGVKTGLNELTSSLKKTQYKIKEVFKSFSDNTVEEQFNNISQEASRSSKAIETEMNKSTRTFDKLNEKLKNTQTELKSVESEIDGIVEEAIDQFSMFTGKISDADFNKLVQGQLDSNKEYQNLLQKQDELNAKTEEYTNKMQQAKDRISELNTELQESKRLEQEQATVKGINNQVGQEINANKILEGISTQEQYNKKLEETKSKLAQIEQLTEQISNQQANGNVTQASKLKQKALETNTEYQKLQKQLQILQGAQGKFTNEVQKTTKAQKSSNDASKAITKGISGGIKSLAKYALALLSIRSMYNVLSNAANSWLNSTDAAAKQIKSNFEYMSYAVGSAFKPVLIWIQNALYKILSIIASIIKTFTGVNIFANASAKAYAKMANSASSTAKSTKEVKNNLANFDTLDVLPNNNADTGNSGGSDVATPNIDLSNVDTFNIALDGIYEKLKTIWDIFKQGFDISFGDTNFDGIITHLGNIKDTLINIWSDPEVINASANWAKTLIYTLGQVTGSVARIGVNIAENLVGSIDKYLSQNTDRIKSFIINMFNISSDQFTLIGNFMQALGEISDVLSGDTAKQIGANLIAMFANPFMSITELISKFTMDLSSILLQPIIDNADKIKLALENKFKPLETVTGTVSTALTYIGDKMNEVYDTYIHPFMESIKVGVSDTFGKFLDVYNQYVAPFLNNVATGIQTLWSEHLQPLVDRIGEFVGAIVEALQVLWENWLKPLIDWIIQNIIPVLVPIFESIWNTISTVFGSIADTIGGIIQTFTGLIDFIVGVFTGDWNKAWEGIKTFFSGIWNTIKGIVSTVWNAIYGVISTVITTIKGIIVTVFNAIKDFISTVFNTIKTVISTIWNGIKTIIFNVINSIKTSISNVFNSIKSTITNIWNSIKTTISNVVTSIKNSIVNTFTKAYNSITSLFSKLKSFFSNIWNSIKNTFTKLGTSIGSAISNAVKSGINNVITLIEKTINKAIGLINGCIGVINAIPGVNISKISTLKIPRLAKGGIVNQPTQAVIGEAGKEAVLPLENNTEWMDIFAEKIATVLASVLMNNNNRDINLNFDGTLSQLIRLLKIELDRENTRKGDKLVIGGNS